MRLLMVEDDEELCEAVAFQIRKEGYDLDVCHNGEDALYYINQGTHDLIILDRMIPAIDGLALLAKIRAGGISVPVIMVTAMNGLYDRVDGLDHGADDYLVKPFDMEELLARIRALLRRPRKMEDIEIFIFGDLAYDSRTAQLGNGENSITLSKREASLMEFFILNQDRTLTRDQILSRVWGDNFVEEGNLDNYIYFLRRRLKAIHSGVVIKTVHGIGYRMEKQHQQEGC